MILGPCLVKAQETSRNLLEVERIVDDTGVVSLAGHQVLPRRSCGPPDRDPRPRRDPAVPEPLSPTRSADPPHHDRRATSSRRPVRSRDAHRHDLQPGEPVSPRSWRGPTSQAASDDKLAQLKTTIEAIAPDVLGVQEVGQPDALEDLRAALGQDWHAITSQHPDRRGIRVGFLSRLPSAEHEDVVSFPDVLRPIQESHDGDLEH